MCGKHLAFINLFFTKMNYTQCVQVSIYMRNEIVVHFNHYSIKILKMIINFFSNLENLRRSLKSLRTFSQKSPTSCFLHKKKENPKKFQELYQIFRFEEGKRM